MTWTEQHDILLLREILNQQPWKHRHGSVERGQCWEMIAAVLNSLEEPKFKVSSRSVRDRYTLLSKKFKAKRAAEDKASGISPEPSEKDEALLDLIERFSEADEEHQKKSAEKKTKAEGDIAKAQEMREKALETFGETKKRKDLENGEGSSKRARRSSTDLLSYLKEKSEKDHELRQQELRMKQEQINLQAQNQHAQFLLLQQQNSAMIELIKSMKK